MHNRKFIIPDIKLTGLGTQEAIIAYAKQNPSQLYSDLNTLSYALGNNGIKKRFTDTLTTPAVIRALLKGLKNKEQKNSVRQWIDDTEEINPTARILLREHTNAAKQEALAQIDAKPAHEKCETIKQGLNAEALLITEKELTLAWLHAMTPQQIANLTRDPKITETFNAHGINLSDMAYQKAVFDDNNAAPQEIDLSALNSPILAQLLPPPQQG